MNVAEGLEELRVNLLKDDATLASGPDDSLWSDATLLRYWNDGISRFARESLVLRDNTTPEVVEITLVEGQTEYTLHPAILSVISAKYSTSAYDMPRVGHSLLNYSRPNDPWWFNSTTADAWSPGPTLAYTTDETLNTDVGSAVVLRLWPAPSAAEEELIIHLRVARMPLVSLSLDKLKACPEIPAAYHLDSLEWAAYRAFRTGDVDGASDKATMHRSRFEEAIAEVMKDTRRKLHAPMHWGFGQNGFTWSSNDGY